MVYIHYLQGVRSQTVTSNLDLTGRKYAINFNLNVDSDQGRLGIYAWMNTVDLMRPQMSPFRKAVKKTRNWEKQ